MPDLLADPATRARRGAPARPSRPVPPRPDARQHSRVLGGVKAALIAAVAGLLIVEAVVLIVWASESRSAAPLSAALRTGAAFWLLGHGGRLHLPAGSAGLIPLGLSAIFAALCAHAGAVTARVRPTGPRRRVILASAAAVGVPYALLAALVAGIAGGGGLRASVITALLGGLVLATLAAGLGAARDLPGAAAKRSTWRAVMAGAAAAAGVLVAAAAVLAAIVLTVHLPDAAALAKPARAGAVGGVGLLALQAALAPNVVTWSAAYLLGPGFAVGAGTIVGPTSTHLGDVPALPIMAGLPSSAAPWPLYILFLVPAAAGAVGALVALRRLPRAPRGVPAAVLGVSIGLIVGVMAGIAAAVSGGPVAGGRLETVGPSALPVGMFAALEIGGAGALTALVIVWLRRRSEAAAAAGPDLDSEITVDVAVPGRLARPWNLTQHRARRAGTATLRGVTWLPRKLRRGAPAEEPPAAEVVDLTKHEPAPPEPAPVSLIKHSPPDPAWVGIADDEPTDDFVPFQDLEPPPTPPVDDQPTVEIPVIRDERGGRRPSLTNRLRRKPKEIKLPD